MAESSLPDGAAQCMSYCAAGILPVALWSGAPHVLLGSEPTPLGLRWLAFGGKREPSDADARETALREYNEETGHALPQPELLHLRLYDFQAKYQLFIGIVPYQTELPSFSDADAEREPTLNKRELRWFPLEQLLLGDAFELDGPFPVKPWFQRFIQRERYAIRRAVGLTLLGWV